MDTIYNKRIAVVNITLIALNIIYFLYVETVGDTTDSYSMIKYGAMYAPLIEQDHQYWRLITSVFMHFGISHIANNMFVLFIIGDNLERALGKVKYLFVYLASGVGANAISMYINLSHSRNVVSAGASGAIFGVVGALLWAVIRNNGRLEDLSTRQLVAMIVLTLYFGMTSTGVDNVAHIAGACIGFILSMLLYRKPDRTDQVKADRKYYGPN